MNLQHQVRAALQVQSKVDAVRNRLLQPAMWDAHNAEDEDHQYRNDECRLTGQILAHDLYRRCSPRRLFLPRRRYPASSSSVSNGSI